MAETVAEQQLPLKLLHSAAEAVVAAADGGLAGIDQAERIECPRWKNQAQCACVALSGKRLDLRSQIIKYRMSSDLMEPILRVREIPFAAMHHAMPETTAGGLDLLADRVRFVQKIVQQPDAGQTAARHIEIDKLSLAKCGG